jgi:hypothetical protein
MKIVAAVVLGLMLLMVFNLAVGGCNPPSPRPITKGGFGGGGFPGGKGGFPID